LAPLNIDGRINGAYATIGLLYGGGDFEKSIRIAMQCGQDSDCNPSTAGGILGAMHGYHAIPEKFRAAIPAMSSAKFSYTAYTFDSIVDTSMNRAIAMIESQNGHRAGDLLAIATQSPKPIRVQLYDLGKPIARIPCNDARWK